MPISPLLYYCRNAIASIFQMSDWKTNESDQALIKATWSEDFETLYLLGSKMYL